MDNNTADLVINRNATRNLQITASFHIDHIGWLTGDIGDVTSVSALIKYDHFIGG